MTILGIETSCDETAAGVVIDGKEILSNIIYSQIDIHKQYGGVVPEIASREHLLRIDTIIETALNKAKIKLKDIDIIAYTKEPGLIGSLLVGIQAAKTLGLILNKKTIPINHLKAHVYSVAMSNEINYPYIGMVLSGGHTNLYVVNSPQDIKLIGETMDDAIGECFDKVAKMLNLPYPGGPEIEKWAAKSSLNKPLLPYLLKKRDDYSFSYSGLKTAVLYYIRDYLKQNQKLNNEIIADICYSVQETAFELIKRRLLKAMKVFGIKQVGIGGGVSINKRLRQLLSDINAYFPDKSLCGDNGAMIAGLSYHYL